MLRMSPPARGNRLWCKGEIWKVKRCGAFAAIRADREGQGRYGMEGKKQPELVIQATSRNQEGEGRRQGKT